MRFFVKLKLSCLYNLEGENYFRYCICNLLEAVKVFEFLITHMKLIHGNSESV